MSRVFATQENDNLLLLIKRIRAFDLYNSIKKAIIQRTMFHIIGALSAIFMPENRISRLLF